LAETKPFTIRYQCHSCDEWHETAPSLGYDFPQHYGVLSAESQKAYAKLDSDFCIIRHPQDNGPAHFVRTLLQVPILGCAEPFLWGVWVSLSAANFEKYEQLFTARADGRGESYFGWLCNILPGYPDTLGLKCNVLPQEGGLRPLLALEPSDHPLARDFAQGITQEQAKLLFERAVQPRNIA